VWELSIRLWLAWPKQMQSRFNLDEPAGADVDRGIGLVRDRVLPLTAGDLPDIHRHSAVVVAELLDAVGEARDGPERVHPLLMVAPGGRRRPFRALSSRRPPSCA